MKKRIAVFLSAFLLAGTIAGCGLRFPADDGGGSNALSCEGYNLKQVVVLSRHNIRAPLSDKGSVLDTMTPHDWVSWSSGPSDLSVRGGVLETEMGQFFRKQLEEEGLFPEDYMPEEGEVRIYANSMQRTIATAGFFKAGLLPVADMSVEHHAEFDTMDPVFNPRLTFVSDKYALAAKEEIHSLFDSRIGELAENYRLLSDVIDVERSEDWAAGNFTGFKTDDTELILEEGAEPGMSGSLKTACRISDALVLQYYEGDDREAAFGKNLTDAQWKDIAEIKDVYGDVLFTAPLIAANVANPLLKEILSELEEEDRKFTFLCGHDSNIGSVLAALSVSDYELPDAIEKKTPIGCKVVFCTYSDEKEDDFISIDMVYQTVDQLRGVTLLDGENPPAVVRLDLAGTEANADGLYPADAVKERFAEAISRYDEIRR